MKIIDNVKQYRCKTSVITDLHDIPLNLKFISTNCGQSQYHISKTIQVNQKTTAKTNLN